MHESPPTSGCAAGGDPQRPTKNRDLAPTGVLDATRDDDALLSGRYLAAASLGLFLGPVVAATAGAALLGGSPVGQLTGAVAGGVLAMAVAAAVTRIYCRSE